MSSAGPEACELYLGAGTLARSGQPVRRVEHGDPAAALRAELAQVERRGRWRRRRRVRLWLSSALARPFLLPPVSGLGNAREAQALAQALAAESTGLEGPCAVWTEAARGQTRTMAVAMPAGVRQAALDAVRDQGFVLQTLRPWWSRALDEHVQRQASGDGIEALAVHDTDGLVLLAARDQAWELASTDVPRPPPDRAEAVIARRLFACGLEAGATIHARMADDDGIAAPWLAASMAAGAPAR